MMEYMPRQEIEQLQLERLQSTLNRVYKNVRHYRKIMLARDYLPEDLCSLKDLKQLPLTTRQDLISNYPYGMFAVPLREVVRLDAPGLNLDDPVVMGFTRNDLKNLSHQTARNLKAVGVDKDDIVQIALNFGIITGPFGIQLGAEKIGASVIPMSGSKAAAQLKIIKDFRTTTLVGTPSFALALVHAMETMGIDPNALALKYGIFGSEPWSEDTRRQIEEHLHLDAFDTYSLTEVFGHGIAFECRQKNGLHISEDHFIPEIIDPLTLESLPAGSEGELILTTLSKEAYPLIRFRTGDLASIDYTPCACGRTHCRISRIFKRCDDIMIIRGTAIFPEQIGKIIIRENGLESKYQLIVDRVNDQDQLIVLIEVSERFFFDEMKKQRKFVEKMETMISELVGWQIKVKLVEPGTTNSSS